MKRQTPRVLQLVCTFFCFIVLNSCLKDNCRHTYTLFTPIFKSLTEARANMKSMAPTPLENTGKLFILGNYIFLSEVNKGIHVIDNSQPASPKNISFIAVPGNVDLAVAGNTLYADSYADLVAFDISNPKQVTAKKFLNKLFTDKAYYVGSGSNPDSIKVIVDWIKRDTTVDCETYSYLYNNYYFRGLADMRGNYSLASSAQSGVPGGLAAKGMGGSMARFALLNQYLYALNSTNLISVDISSPQNPVQSGTTGIGWGIETIYPFNDKLFIGSTNGMFIYDVSNASSPSKLGQFTHVTSCDPVIADGSYAYVTLRTGTMCAGNTNRLDVVNISSLTNPSLTKSYNLTNPHGLSKDGNLLFICDGTDGLKIYNAGNPSDAKLLKRIEGIETYDVIAWNNKALVVAKDGLYQFDYSDPSNIKLLSKISINK